MTQRHIAIACGVAAVLAACVFLFIATDHHVYAPGARAVQQDLARTNNYSDPVLHSYGFGKVVYLVIRKSYSVVAFAIVGFFAAPALGKPSQRPLRAAIAVALFSLLIEIVQRSTGSQESYLHSGFDVGCGAVGGALGGWAWNFVARRFLKEAA